jgi:hypothetical protein
MSENEIVKHVEAAYKAAKDPEKNWLHKLKEILIEIFIIVFAVTLSIWFHNWSDSLHERKEEREFLVGLQKDIHDDLESAKSSRVFYARQLYKLRYFLRVGAGEPLNADSMLTYQDVFFSNTTLDAPISRYEALKGSGKFGIIENKELLNNIIDLHEGTFKRVQLLDGYYTDYTVRMGTFIQSHGQLSQTYDKIANAQELMRMSEMRFLLVYGISSITANVLSAHDSCIAKCHQLISEIGKELQ